MKFYAAYYTREDGDLIYKWVDVWLTECLKITDNIRDMFLRATVTAIARAMSLKNRTARFTAV